MKSILQTFLRNTSLLFLIFSFVLAPVAPIFAQEAIETPTPVISESSEMLDSVIPTVTSVVLETEPSTESELVSSDTLLPEDTDAVKDSKSEIPIDEDSEEVPIDPEPEMMMSSSGGYFGDTRDAGNLTLPQANLSSGALTYEYPLTVPPGRNNFTPKLNLKYSSSNTDQDSAFGYGWSLNIPYIERLNKTGVENLYTDDYFRSSLSGDLVNVSSGVYAPASENGDFIKYALASNVWTLTDKNGTTYKFGLTSNSRQDDPGNSSNVARWMLEEVRDMNDNYIEYSYYKDAGQIYPDIITYTGNNTTDGIFTVVFSRSSRSDEIVQYKYGFEVTTSYKITDIQAKISGTWVRKYVLAYTTGDNTEKSLLNTITESGQDESLNVTTLPPVTFTYQTATSTPNFVTDSAWGTAVSETINTAGQYGAIVADVNGDSLPDLMESWYSYGAETWYKGTYLNNGDGTWTEDTNLTPPIEFSCPCAPGGTYAEEGIRAADVNGDGKTDLVQSVNMGGGYIGRTYINKGTYWDLDTDWEPAGMFFSNTWGDTGTRLVDINGDGLPDFITATGDSSWGAPITTSVSLNTGSDWTSDTGWTSPIDLRSGVILVDYNGDGLVDMLQGYKNYSNVETKAAYKNNGDKTWSLDTTYTPPIVFFAYAWGAGQPVSTGAQFGDINGDGLVDILKGSETTNGAYLNTGTGWEFVTNWGFESGSAPLTTSSPIRIADFNGDGMLDKYDSASGSATLSKNQNVKADLLKTITNIYGGVSTITYKGSPQYASGGATLNPNMPVTVDTPYQITTTSGFNNPTITKTYSYEEGDYYFNDHIDRKLSGFGKITESDGTTKTTTYFHQGNSTNTSQGEYSDHVSKIGQIYRTEVADTSGNIHKKIVNKWDKYNQGTGRDFVHLVRSTVLTYDGDGDHKDTSTEYAYDTTYGNLTTKTTWGEVTASDDGSFTDTGSDKAVETITYTANTTDWIVGLPYQNTVVDQSSAKVRETKTYYDAQSLGTVTNGNPTKVEKWKASSSYVNTEKAYNTTYGVPTSSTDERGKVTSYIYDSDYLYPVTITDPLSNDTDYVYDYSLGKPKQVTEPNGFVYERTYDGLDRTIAEKVPGFSNPYTPVTKTSYAYTDTAGSVSIAKTDNLDGSTSVSSYKYFDGLNRIIQGRQESESTYAVKDYLYNNTGLLQKESLPYDSSGSSNTSATGTTTLYKTYTYDASQRPLVVTNAVGSTNYAYDDWKTTITDPRGKVKNYYKDAYDNLIAVDEVNGASTYTTSYEWNLNKNLTKITDALGNLRNFTYDGLGRRLTAEDLHASADGTYGSWSYAYDDAGNMTQSVSPEAKTVNYTYDDTNRVLTENETVGSGTEITYAYDSCTNGIGYLCSVTMTSGADTIYTYDSNGNKSSEEKTINGNDYTTSYTYDRLGNILVTTYPDDSEVKNTYNTAGQLEKIERKESGGSYTDVVSDFDYGPHGKVTYQEDANGVETVNTYNSKELYRLLNRRTSSGTIPTFNDNPVITLTGANIINLYVGDTWNEPGYIATDTEDGTITGSVSISGSVNTSVAGIYQLTYSVSDSQNAPAAVQMRTVLVTTPTSQYNVWGLVVGGGGGGGYFNYGPGYGGGGGGGGGFVEDTSIPVTAQAYTITVGAGGSTNSNGSNSSALGITANGGGGGGYSGNGNNGGSGGGGAAGSTNSGGTGSQGYSGGDSASSAAGGGGGAGGAGDNGVSNLAGNGGIGALSSVSGSSLRYAGGGGGGYANGGSGGAGGGGAGGSYPVAGTANTGGGGGGGGYFGPGGTGGSGIVVIAYKTDGSDGVDPSSTGGAKTTSGAYTIHTFNSSGTFTVVTASLPSNYNPVIGLVGLDLININEGDTWSEPGYFASDAEDGTITGDVSVTGSVNTAVPGVYQLVYNVEDSEELPAAGIVRTVVVHGVSNPYPNYLQNINYKYDENGNITKVRDASATNTSKIVTYNYDDLNRMISANSSNIASGESAYTHNYTYNAIGNITASPFGLYTYDGSTGSNYANPHAVTFISDGLPDDNPSITLSGSTIINLEVDDTWTEPGYTATDPEDGTITGDVSITGSVNTAVAGIYQLIYNVEDSVGNPAPGKIRMVVVSEPYAPSSISVKTLVVAGGGSGGQASMYYSGGGGAGGLIYDTSHAVTAQAYSITVGSGGSSWSNGGNSVFSSLTAVGGGRGGSLSAGSKNGNSGGSGGGGSADGSGGSGTSGQGYAGGGSWLNSGGGGGATGAGQTGGSSAPASNGGPGFTTDISGTSVCYAGGGGGVRSGGSPGDGTCGGGTGSYSGSPGTANTGGGGGGNGYSGSNNGGSGIVIVAYKTDGSDGVSNTSTGGTVTTSGAYTIHKFTSSGTFTVVVSSTPPPNDNPVITLTGSDLIDINVGDTWTEPGYSASDTEDGTITGDVSVTGSVNTSVAGIYQLIYNVEDSVDAPALGKVRTVVVHTPSTEITYTYDKDGNLLDDETLTNTWNYKQQLIESDNGVDVLEYWYDHEGQRVRAKNGSDDTYYANKLYNVDPSGKETKSIYAGDTLVSTIETISTVVSPYYIHTDHLGGTNVVTDDSGAQVELLDYFPYGDQRISSGSFTSNKQFGSYYFDVDTDLNYLGARYYQGTSGRFISQDPVFILMGNNSAVEAKANRKLEEILRDPQLLNAYAYARNNPLMFTDSSGEFIDIPWISNSQWVQQGASALYDQSAVWAFTMDNPNLPGIIGAAPLAGYLASTGLTALSMQYMSGAGTACMAFCDKVQQVANNLPNLQRLEQAGSVAAKFERVSRDTGVPANEIISHVQRNGTAYADSATGNINVFAQRLSSSGYYRVTLNPEMNKVISTGLNKASNVINGIANGRFIPLKK